METNFWYTVDLDNLEEYEQLIEALLLTRYDKNEAEREANRWMQAQKEEQQRRIEAEKKIEELNNIIDDYVNKINAQEDLITELNDRLYGKRSPEACYSYYDSYGDTIGIGEEN
jgi:DNA repair exonuclease SbcCD ATPase subunit